MVGYIRLGFFDLSFPVLNMRMFNDDDARDIFEFVDGYVQHDKIDTVVVHCQAGTSRSSAVGCIISKVYNGQEDWFWDHPDFLPNKFVCRTALDWYNLNHDQKSKQPAIWKSKNKNP